MNVLIVGLGGVTATFRHWPERILALALARQGHTVWSIGTRDVHHPALANRHEVIDGVQVFRVRSVYWPNRALAQALERGPRPDIVHVMHPRNVLAAQVTAWAMQRAIPTVYTWLGPFHDHYLTSDRERPFESTPTYERLAFTRTTLLRLLLLERRPRDVLRNYRLHWPLHAATALLPCSEFEATVMRRFGLTQPQTVVPLWVDVPFIESIPHTTPAIGSGRTLLFVGQITPRKGYDVAIQALPAIVATCPDVSLLIVSGLNQQQREHMLELVRRVGIEKHVQFLGYLSDEELMNLYRASDALLFPTRYEGFGLPLLEAMAAGCPVITTDIPVVREIVQDGENGLLVPYSDADALAQATIRLLHDDALRTRLIAGGRTTLRTRYDEQTLVARVVGVYGCLSSFQALGVM